MMQFFLSEIWLLSSMTFAGSWPAVRTRVSLAAMLGAPARAVNTVSDYSNAVFMTACQ